MPEGPIGADDRIVIAGASGLLGRALTGSFRARGADIVRLVRRPARHADEHSWDPGTAPLDPRILAGARAVIGLNGASIGRLPWTPAYRTELFWSRITPTRTLAEALRALGPDAPPFLSASATGFYGAVPQRRVAEDAAPGSGFLADLTVAWEGAAREAGSHTRVTALRFAPVIHQDGVLGPMIRLAKAGLSGPLGTGTQTWPWVALPDALAAVQHVIAARLDGPVNVVGPTRASANDVGFAIARHLQRPYLLRAPRVALRAALGSAADDLLLADTDVIPAVLERTGFTWQHDTVESAVRAALAASAS